MDQINESNFFDEISRNYLTSTKGFKDQDYETLKNECKKNGSLFVDPLFTPTESLHNFKKATSKMKWLRPHQIVKDGLSPSFIVNKPESHDLDQGMLGNCWFVAGIAKLSSYF